MLLYNVALKLITLMTSITCISVGGKGVSFSNELTKSKLGGYIMAMHYTDQLTGSSANFLNLQCFTGHHLKNVKTVEPFLLSIGTILGTHLSPSFENLRPDEVNIVKLSDIFDIGSWEAYTNSRKYAPFVSWNTFLQRHPKQLILVHHTWTTKECDPLIMTNMTKEFIKDNEFEVVRRVCLDFRQTGVLSVQKFVEVVYGPYNPDQVVAVFNFWGGIAGGIQTYRLSIRGTTCGRGNDVRLSHQSKLIAGDVKNYTAQYMNNARSYVGIMIRFEYYGINHNLASQPPNSQRSKLLDCFKKLSTKVESIKREKNIKETLLTMDFSRYGSCAFWRKKNPYIDISVLNETVPNLFEMLFGNSFSLDEWEQSFVSVAHFKVPGYIAIMQKTLAANSDCLLVIGGGSFQGSAKTLHNELHPGAGCVVNMC